LIMTLTLTVQSPADASSAKAKTAAVVDLPPDIFDVPTNVSLIHQVVVAPPQT